MRAFLLLFLSEFDRTELLRIKQTSLNKYNDGSHLTPHFLFLNTKMCMCMFVFMCVLKGSVVRFLRSAQKAALRQTMAKNGKKRKGKENNIQ